MYAEPPALNSQLIAVFYPVLGSQIKLSLQNSKEFSPVPCSLPSRNDPHEPLALYSELRSLLPSGS